VQGQVWRVWQDWRKLQLSDVLFTANEEERMKDEITEEKWNERLMKISKKELILEIDKGMDKSAKILTLFLVIGTVIEFIMGLLSKC